ncbi:M20 family metallopeptidase [Undibacterium sp.]|uniref:M20 family metallopeptidase n=1 Tax=Undibacterium sp. TaxID=1914977 RepID=UPI00374DBEE4
MAISDETMAKLDPKALQDFVDGKWDREIVPNLTSYIEIPAKSPMFDAAWEQNGYIDKVVRDAADWIRGQKVRGLTLELIRLPGRTPVLFFEVPANGPAGADTVFMYGHLDKQPEFSGWRNGFGPWTPKYVDGKLYGRGGADDGYAVYAALTAIQALDAQDLPRPRCVGLIETCEESGSYDLLPYIDALKPRLGDVSLVVCLDSGAGNYDQLWLSTSLRGAISGSLEVQVLEEGVHSGESSGVIPSTFRIMRQLIDRLEDSKTGRLLPSSFHCEVPPERLKQAQQTAAILGDEVWKNYPWSCGADGNSVLPMVDDPLKALINRTWNPTLSVTGAEGLPPLADAGNVLRPRTAFKLSIRLPPLVEAVPAVEELKNLLEVDPPYNAKVIFKPSQGSATGWNAPITQPWLSRALDDASNQYFGAPCGYIGQGGTIPLMNMLEKGFPKAQFMVCGVLGPKSNAHGPNEFLHVPFGKKLTAAVAQVISSAALKE